MLRITTNVVNDELVIKLEGCLIGGWVHEVEACWREAAASRARRLHVDLTDVCHVDEVGRALMRDMFREGARFSARGCVMPELVKEIANAVRSAGN